MPLSPKALSTSAIPRAIKKAERYRLLNDPVSAESICLDVLKADPQSQDALVTLILAITDQFGAGYRIGDADPAELIARLSNPYDRAYYAGLVAERRAKAVLDKNAPQSSFRAYDLLTEAMKYYDQAGELRPPGNDDALLRWNTCVRLMNSHGVQPRGEGSLETLE